MDKLDIVTVLEHYGADCGRVDPSRKYTKIRCPFHGADRTPSACVYPERESFKCFACDVQGDGWDIIMSQEGFGEDWSLAFQFARDQFGYEGAEVRRVADEQAFDIGAYLDGLR